MKDLEKFFLVIVTTIGFMGCSSAYNHTVGGLIWSIPISQDFYTNWSTTSVFQVGDSLVFDFELGLYNVIQVSSREYEDCTAYNPFRVFRKGPANVPLDEEGVLYFICSLGNYCLLGQKLSVQVQKSSSVPSQPSKEQPRLLAGLTTPSPHPYIQPVHAGHKKLESNPGGSTQLSSFSGPAIPLSIVESSITSSSSADADWSGCFRIMTIFAGVVIIHDFFFIKEF